MKRAIQCRELMDWIVGQVVPGDAALDIGCGNKWYWPALRGAGISDLVGVDAWARFQPDIQLDLEESPLPILPRSFDLVLLLDVIEHLEKQNGLSLLEQARSIARRRVLVLTPLLWDSNWPPANPDYRGNSFERHKSLWQVGDFSGWNRAETLRFARGKYYVGAFDVAV